MITKAISILVVQFFIVTACFSQDVCFTIPDDDYPQARDDFGEIYEYDRYVQETEAQGDTPLSKGAYIKYRMAKEWQGKLKTYREKIAIDQARDSVTVPDFN